MKYAVGPVTVVRQKHEALGVDVETADRVEALAGADEVGHAGPAALRTRARHDPRRLVQRDVARPLRRRDRAPVDLDVRRRRHLRAQLAHETPVDAHPTSGDEHFRVPA